MEHSLTRLDDLPDEILIIILKKLHNCDVLYSLIGVNKRLDTIANDSIFTKNLTLTKYDDDSNQFADTMLDRFCREILPKIHHNIEWLNVESSDVERIFTTDYPNLHRLELHNLSEETARHLFTDESCFIRLCKSQISSLVVGIKQFKKRNKKKLPNLKCFSFTYKSAFWLYDEFPVALIHRMLNLEQLSLYFINYGRSIIDGNNLEVNIINRLPRLNKFTFDIRSKIHVTEFVELPSDEDIKNTFTNFKNDEIITCLDYFPKSEAFHCHIYSYPHSLKWYLYISNNFHRGLFKHVRIISLFDERPFECEFFLEVAQSFPFIKGLFVNNAEPQKNDNQQQSIIEYRHLTILFLVEAHDNYVEQCLLNTKMCLLNNADLHVTYDSLEQVTHHFTREATRFNCSKIKALHLKNKPEFCSVHLQDYFPHAKIY